MQLASFLNFLPSGDLRQSFPKRSLLRALAAQEEKNMTAETVAFNKRLTQHRRVKHLVQHQRHYQALERLVVQNQQLWN